jgi:hypothetical protein
MDEDISNHQISELLERMWQCHLPLTDPNEDKNHLEWFEEHGAIQCELDTRPDWDAAACSDRMRIAAKSSII